MPLVASKNSQFQSKNLYPCSDKTAQKPYLIGRHIPIPIAYIREYPSELMHVNLS